MGNFNNMTHIIKKFLIIYTICCMVLLLFKIICSLPIVLNTNLYHINYSYSLILLLESWLAKLFINLIQKMIYEDYLTNKI